jgi:hypothetical protein
VDSSLVIASGVVTIPTTAKHVALVSYQRGTRLLKEDPDGSLKEENLIFAVLSADGYATCSPDYIGLGCSMEPQAYLHSKTEAWTAIDNIRATRQFLDSISYELNDQVFLCGYSQGGHAAMSAHREIEARYSDEIKLTAVGPMSGPYDLAGAQLEMIEPGMDYARPSYLPFLLMGMNRAYGFVENTEDLFRPPYDSLLPPLLCGSNDFDVIKKLMPEDPYQVLKPELLNRLVGDGSGLLNQILEANSPYENFTPETPVYLCYCKQDEIVSYENSIVAFKHFKEQGSSNVRKNQVAKKKNHVECAYYALIYEKLWFDSFRKGKERGRKGPFFKRGLITLSKLFN